MKSSSAQLRLGPVALQREFQGEISPKDHQQPSWLTESVATVVHAQRGMVARIASALEVSEREVYRVADINAATPLKAHWIPVICRETATFTLLDVLEAQMARVAFRLPAVNPHVEEMNRELARTVQEFGTFLETNGDVLADGKLEPHEVPLMLRAIDTMLADLSAYREIVLLKAAMDAPPAMAKAALR